MNFNTSASNQHHLKSNCQSGTGGQKDDGKNEWTVLFDDLLSQETTEKSKRVRVIQNNDRIMVDIRLFYKDKATKYGVTCYEDEFDQLVFALKDNHKWSQIKSWRIVSFEPAQYKGGSSSLSITSKRTGVTRYVYLNDRDIEGIIKNANEINILIRKFG